MARRSPYTTAMKTHPSARRFALAAVATAASLSLAAGCASDDPATDELPPETMSNVEGNVGALNGVPPELASQMEADVAAEGGTISGEPRVLGGEAGASVYRLTYTVDGQAKQADYDRNGRRLATLGEAPAQGGQRAAGATPGDSSGPIEQRAEQIDDSPGSGMDQVTADSPTVINDAGTDVNNDNDAYDSGTRGFDNDGTVIVPVPANNGNANTNGGGMNNNGGGTGN